MTAFSMSRLRVAALAATIIAAPLTASAFEADELANACFCPECISGGFGMYQMSSGSMLPNLAPLDCLIFKTSWGPRPVERGDVLLFHHPLRESVFVKRVVGLPGDSIQVKGGRLILNGQPVGLERAGVYKEKYVARGDPDFFPRCSNAPVHKGDTCIKERFIETLPSGRSYYTLNIGDTPADNTGVYTVPDGYYFFLGDNRDNSMDSRFPQSMGGLGFIGEEFLLGVFERYAPTLGEYLNQ